MQTCRPNVLLIVLDTVRAGNLSNFEYHRDTSPFLNRFADESIEFRQAHAPAPWTTPSHASIFTGAPVVAHQTNRERQRLTPDLQSLPELFSDNGYSTAGFSNNAHIAPDFDFDRGFDDFTFNTESYNEPFKNAVSISRIRSKTGSGSFPNQSVEALRYAAQNEGSISKTFLNWLYRKAHEFGIISTKDRGAASTNAFAQKYMQNNDGRPFFMYLNFMEGHAPYEAPNHFKYKYTENPSVSSWESQAAYFAQSVTDQERKIHDLRDQYDGCIRYLDSKIKHLINKMKENGVFDDTVVVITSDHGEAFGEHGLYEHKTGVFDELSHVPLIINPPENISKTIDLPVSVRWVFSTICEYGNISTPEYSSNVDIMKPKQKPVLIESEGLPYDNYIYDSSLPRKFDAPQFGYVHGNKKTIYYERDESAELFATGNESNDLSAKHPDVTQESVNALQNLLKENRRPDRRDIGDDVEVSPETREHLRELGYR